jgi:DNA-binding CsgD family transcriptional regulator
MTDIAAGMLPSDARIEFFADPQSFGRLYFATRGQVLPFSSLPREVREDLRDELLSDTRALKGLRLMGITQEDQMLEMYNYCNRGRLSTTGDISSEGKKSKEFFDCGRRERCVGEGKVCNCLTINGSRITHRELECLRLIAQGLSYKSICLEMGFRRETAVASLIDRLRDKLQCGNQTEIALKVREVGLI